MTGRQLRRLGASACTPSFRSERRCDAPPPDGRPGHARAFELLLEPAAHVLLQADAVHEVVQRFSERVAETVVVHAGRVAEPDVVPRKGTLGKRLQRYPVVLRIPAHRRVHGAGEAVEEAAVNATVYK